MSIGEAEVPLPQLVYVGLDFAQFTIDEPGGRTRVEPFMASVPGRRCRRSADA
jgi:hypothetical protein